MIVENGREGRDNMWRILVVNHNLPTLFPQLFHEVILMLSTGKLWTKTEIVQ